ncbi:Catalase [Chitinophaga sp. CF118]|uniref:catalase n=1 Tax=Chitinophaga sp. CF118 TaxID=1884367 RepID=UPI0008F20BE2|nr:catalase [Chitinophaga sp. CF118]SFD98088.1 Catalase [Chitinophaga sp. CF118]
MSWKEIYLNEKGKSDPKSNEERENVFFKTLCNDIKDVVKHFTADNGCPMRGNHAKILAGFQKAEFVVSTDIKNDLAVGFLKPGRKYEAFVRFSNASSQVNADDSNPPDLRGVAIRVLTKRPGEEEHDHDFLMTNAEKHHAKNAREEMATIMAGKRRDTLEDNHSMVVKLGTLTYLSWKVGLLSAFRIGRTLKNQMKREVKSLKSETYWSRVPIAVGKDLKNAQYQSTAVKYRLKPSVEGYLAQELLSRSNQMKFLFQVQRFRDNDATPIEDARVVWPTPFETIAVLTITDDSEINNELIDALEFNPWNVNPNHFKPIGNMNRSRKTVYPASASTRCKNNQQAI